MAELRLRIVGECVIEVGERELTPDAPHLFALALYLGVERGRPISRAELCELLFPRARSAKRAAHNLRQLLYRLRHFGVPFCDATSTVRLRANCNAPLLGHLAELTAAERANTRDNDWLALPGYEPSVSSPFAEWVEVVRERVGADSRALILSDLQTAKEKCDWRSTIRLGRLAQQLGAGNEHVVTAVVEALLIDGRRAEALGAIDAFVASQAGPPDNGLNKLRARVAKAFVERPTLQAPLRGREGALHELVTRLTLARSGASELCVLLGHAGIGKTRLREAFASHAMVTGVQTLSYRCDASDVQRPLSAFVHFVSRLRTMRGALGASPSYGALLDLLTGDASARPALEPAHLDAVRHDIILAISDLVDAVCSEQPLLLQIEDAEFLDPASWAVIASLCHSARHMRLLVLCCVRGSQIPSHFRTARIRLHTLHLMPLSEADSTAVLSDLLPSHQHDSRFLRWCLSQSGGNPFFLHALAQHALEVGDDMSIPFDIRQLAATFYHALEPSARTVLDACLLLGRFASLSRLRAVCGLGTEAIVAAVRRLETDGLLVFSEGVFSGSHAILVDALRALIPPGVAAATHDAIARCLSAEFELDQASMPLAWAAADSWLVAGNTFAAVELLRRCAARSLAMGEPVSAASTLARIPLDRLPLDDQRKILDDIIEYADVGRDYVLLRDSLTARLGIVRSAHDKRSTYLELRERLISSQIVETDPRGFVPELRSIALESNASIDVRARAAIRLLTSADALLDRELAEDTCRIVDTFIEQLPNDDLARNRLALVYETVFGSEERAASLAEHLLERCCIPALDRKSLSARHDAVFALVRLGHFERVQPLLEETFAFMLTHGVRTEAVYSLLLLADAEVAQGHSAKCEHWLREVEEICANEPIRPLGYYSVAAELAIVDHHNDRVAPLLDEVRRNYPAIQSPRMAAYWLSLELLASFQHIGALERRRMATELRALYDLGRDLGAQDVIVAALWRHDRAVSGEKDSSELLESYLRNFRRERSRPTRILEVVTAEDPVWTSGNPSNSALLGAGSR